MLTRQAGGNGPCLITLQAMLSFLAIHDNVDKPTLATTSSLLESSTYLVVYSNNVI